MPQLGAVAHGIQRKGSQGPRCLPGVTTGGWDKAPRVLVRGP